MALISFGQYIKIKREALNFTLEEAGTRMGASPSSIYHWETDRAKPSQKSLAKLKKLYGMTDLELIEYGMEASAEYKSGISIASILTSMKALQNHLEVFMTGGSQFEMNIKDRAIARLDQAMEVLSHISIIDEAL